MTPLEDVGRLVAYQEIQQLASHYAVAIDSRDLDALVALFVDDVRVGRDGRGRDELKRFFEVSLRAVGVTILNVGTHAIDLLDADHAHGWVYCKGEIEDGARWIHQAILYEDAYERRQGQWYFARRQHRLFYGVEVQPNPMSLPPADWPANHDGRGTVPECWETWRRFWSDAHQ